MVTKALLDCFLISNISDLKKNVRSFELCSYLTGDTATRLWGHLSNMHVNMYYDMVCSALFLQGVMYTVYMYNFVEYWWPFCHAITSTKCAR